MKIKRILACAFISMTCVAHVQAARPDSAYIFSYSPTDGSGLRLAWSTDKAQWKNVNNGRAMLTSDFGPWGRNDYSKKMYNPILRQSAVDGGWYCLWNVAKTDKVVAHATSSDLILWTPQTYYASSADVPASICSAYVPVAKASVIVNGASQNGYIQRVPFSLIERLNRYGNHVSYRTALHNEVMADDSIRYASLKPVEATLRVFADSTKTISPTLIGIFFEDINYGADGGLYAELVQNRDFEYSPRDKKGWTADYAWDAADGKVKIDTVAPLHSNNKHYAVLRGGVLKNAGYDGIAVQKGDRYNLSLYSRTDGGSVPMTVSLVAPDGKTLASCRLKSSAKKWKKLSAQLVPSQTCDSATLIIEAVGDNTVNLDMISLFPAKTFKGRVNGLRADLAQTLADLKPKFVRFPGGCVAHGNGVDNIYDWKGSIGELYARKPLFNIWGYHQTRGLGYHEYFLFCEDIEAEPLPVLAAGVPCQNSSRQSAHSHDMLTTNGQQCGIPMAQMGQYIQDVLDLIEYANGDARKTIWGRERAKAGHPEPFNLKYIGIGNEDMITPVFAERFTMIAKAVQEKYPEIKIVGTAGPFYEGSDYTYGWQLADSMGIALVDEHYYVTPGWMVNNQDFYDSYDRSQPHVYLGEYAAHLRDRSSNMETALSEALYLTAVERNADVVDMTSYAPLLAKEGHTQWRPDLIYFSNTQVKPTTDYYVQQMYGQNSGTTYIASAIVADKLPQEAAKRQGASVVYDPESNEYIVKLANLLPVETTMKLDFGQLPVDLTSVTTTVLSGAPDDHSATPQYSTASLADGHIILPRYSFTVLRIPARL
ncbi:MAG: carbohydrate binding domain-containing protein [Muribaculum sp.]|nr:carbohydrate binding domain-containing protein [Muribaculaceae bacterium]MCM1080926.1 carbohydrate binding domain-containing protein [Muribaculum sp.]